MAPDLMEEKKLLNKNLLLTSTRVKPDGVKLISKSGSS